MSFRCSKPIPEPVETLKFKPWTLAVEPFQVSPNTYYVSGQKWVGAYLIDTGEGCILIDTGIPESLYLLVNSIYKLGYKPSDIKIILVSHAHFDHMGGAMAMKELTGAKLYISKEDAEFINKSFDETYIPEAGSLCQIIDKFDGYLKDDTPVKLGNITVNTLLTPGHTIGCTSFFWEETNPVNNERYVVAMHGGVGANTMNDEYYKTSKCLTPKLRERFLQDAAKVGDMHVDIALPSHPNQIEIMDVAGSYTHESQPYLDPTVWKDFVNERVRQVKVLMENK